MRLSFARLGLVVATLAVSGCVSAPGFGSEAASVRSNTGSSTSRHDPPLLGLMVDSPDAGPHGALTLSPHSMHGATLN